MGFQPKILIVDDQAPNREILRDILLTLRMTPIETGDGAAALELLENEEVDLVLLDLVMPRMNGFATLEKLKADPRWRDLPVIIVSSIDEMRSVLHCIEIGAEDYLARPVKPRLLEARVRNALEKRRLSNLTKSLLERTLRESIKALTNVLAMANPTAFSRGERLAGMIVPLAQQLGIEPLWELEIAALLSQLGLVAVPEAILLKVAQGEALSDKESQIMREHPVAGCKLIAGIPQLEPVAEIIKHHQKPYGTPGSSKNSAWHGPFGGQLPPGSRMLKVLLDFDTLILAGSGSGDALENMRARQGVYDPEILNALERTLPLEGENPTRLMPAARLRPGMVLGEDLKTASGVLLMARGFRVTESLCDRLANHSAIGDEVAEPIRISAAA